MPACLHAGFETTQIGSISYGNFNRSEELSPISVKLERLKHHLLHPPGAPGYIHQRQHEEINQRHAVATDERAMGCYDAGFRVAEIGSRGCFVTFLGFAAPIFTWNFF